MDKGYIRIDGPMAFDTAERLCSLPRTWPPATSLTIDLSGVTRADSAGLAVMLEWLRQARALGRRLVFVSVPPRLDALIRVSGLGALLNDRHP